MVQIGLKRNSCPLLITVLRTNSCQANMTFTDFSAKMTVLIIK